MLLLSASLAIGSVVATTAPAEAAIRRVSSATGLTNAVAAANPGDVIEIAGGSYRVNLVITRSGTSSAPITLRPVSGQAVILSAANSATRVIDLRSASYWKIDRLKMRGTRHAVVQISGGTHNTISNCEIYDSTKKGIIANGDSIVIEGCTFHDIKQPVGGEDTQSIAAWRASRLRIRDNLFASPGDGILIGGAGQLSLTSTDVRIYRNHFHAKDSWYGTWHTENAIDIKNVDGLVITDNVIHHYRGHADDDPMGTGMNIVTRDPEVNGTIANVRVERNKFYDLVRAVAIMGADGPGRNLVFRQNVVYAALWDNAVEAKPPGAIYIGDWSGAKIDNNTLVDIDNAAVYTHGDLDGFTFRNNILRRSAGLVRENSGGVIDYTCRFSSGSTNGRHDVVANQRFVDDAGRDYRLTADSPCVDRGAGVGLPYRGAAPDMGRYEYDGVARSALTMPSDEEPAEPPEDGRPPDWASVSSESPSDVELGPELGWYTQPGMSADLLEDDPPAARLSQDEGGGVRHVPPPSSAGVAMAGASNGGCGIAPGARVGSGSWIVVLFALASATVFRRVT